MSNASGTVRIVAGTLAFALLCEWTGSPANSLGEFELRAISSRPDTVSGEDVLVGMHASPDHRWVALLNGREVTGSFRRADREDELIGLIKNLKVGKNVLEVRVSGKTKSKLEIHDYPLTGPIFSGPHQEPFICQTIENGLGPATDSNCNAKTIVQYFYKSTEPSDKFSLEAIEAVFGQRPDRIGPLPGFKVYDPSGAPPSDVAKTITSDGTTRNYIVRREIGTINRSVYEVQFLHQPGEPLPTPWSRSGTGWNGRLLYHFGGGCGVSFRQGTLNRDEPANRVPELLLARGYAVATSTLNIFGNSCNDRISAETLSMVKEHFIEEFGDPVHTIGHGPSGGSMQVQLIAQNYPGLLDGIVATFSFPDLVSSVISQECSLLEHAFNQSKQKWTEEQKTAVSGFAAWRTCADHWSKVRFADPRNCPPSMPKNMVYDRVTNPEGVRCDVYENEINFFGRDPHTRFARRPFDNVGVQYGLVAFNERRINAEQFVEFNEQVGGFNEENDVVAARSVADPETLRIVYENGLILTGGGGLPLVPIIDWRSYGDDLGDIHDRFRSFVTRARLTAASGHADNHVILVGPREDTLDEFLEPDPTRSIAVQREASLVLQMSRWLDNIAADRGGGTAREKVSRNKPGDLTDGCWAANGERIVERASYDRSGKCNQMYPSHGDPRLAAGGPLADDVLKCSLKPIALAEYAQPLTQKQLERLTTVFPGGVCDYSKPGVGQSVTRAIWRRYTALCRNPALPACRP